ncbi:MAG: hypothetical protein Q8K30_04070 [Candidatus Gracilibacteria bacterium]|nr:hypothetical protein [Candidatus Gracilibacteria bacterium]
MFTKTNTYSNEKNDLEINHFFSIPENIQNNINDRGFHLYEWIGSQDVKASIERDFLKYIKKLGVIFAVLLIIPSAILFMAKDITLFIIFFVGFLGIINFIFILILTILAIKRSSILRKNAYVLITDTSISINGKIEKLNNYNINNDNKILKISELFEEELFKESNIEKTKKSFFKQVMDNIGEGYSFIFRIGKGNNKNSGQLVLLLLALYTVYALSLGLIYFVGIIFVWFFGNILSAINKKILLIKGHKITSINKHFEDIDTYSKSLVKEKNELTTLLNNAISNDWKDGLLTHINTGLENINQNADKSINTNIKLKEEINNSEYKEMFNFSIYNSWIKRQILTPLEQISELLSKNLNILSNRKQSIEKQILETTDPSLKGPLVASKTRVEMKIVEIQKHLEKINIYIDKLK